MHPILSLRPFVTFAAPGFLKNLRALGFRTFDELWDESYDGIEDPSERFAAFLEVVDRITRQDLATLQRWGRQITPVVEHNRRHMLQTFIPAELARVRRRFRKWYQL